MVQSTFTRQKRELSKAAALLEKIRAQEVRTITKSPAGEVLEQARDTYVDFAPEIIAHEVLAVVRKVVAEHGARQQANSRNTGKFRWQGIEADLTVPQLRALQDVCGVLGELANRLPRTNPKVIPNTTVDNRPAFAHRLREHYKTETSYVPYEEDSTTRVRTYEEQHQVLDFTTQTVEIDYGLSVTTVEKFREGYVDLKTAIQVAIDDANCKGQTEDPVLESVIGQVCNAFEQLLPPVSTD